MSQTNYIRIVRIKRLIADNDAEKVRFALWLTPDNNSLSKMVKIDRIAISDSEGHRNYSIAFEHGGYSSIMYMGGQENHHEYRWPDIVLNSDEYNRLKQTPNFHLVISVDGNNEEYIIKEVL